MIKKKKHFVRCNPFFKTMGHFEFKKVKKSCSLFLHFFWFKIFGATHSIVESRYIHKIHRSLTYLKAKTVHLQKHLTGEKYNKEQIGVFLEIVQPCRLPIMLSSQNARVQKDQYDDQPKHPLRFACFACIRKYKKKLWLFSADKNMRALAFAKKPHITN